MLLFNCYKPLKNPPIHNDLETKFQVCHPSPIPNEPSQEPAFHSTNNSNHKSQWSKTHIIINLFVCATNIFRFKNNKFTVRVLKNIIFDQMNFTLLKTKTPTQKRNSGKIDFSKNNEKDSPIWRPTSIVHQWFQTLKIFQISNISIKINVFNN